MGSNELDLTSLTADIVSAYVAHNAITGDKLPEFIGSVYGALSRASAQGVEPEELKPAVAIKKSVTRDTSFASKMAKSSNPSSGT